jgi:RHS repeat-associated protein
MYYHGDQIGSSRLMTSDGGWPVWQGTFLPYGEEYNQQITTNHYKFTGKERDSESGLDYFGARYYGSGLGRFITPDWNGVPVPVPYADLTDPQSLNEYSYVRNIPTVRVDADGHDTYFSSQKAEDEYGARMDKVDAFVVRALNHPAVQAYIEVFAFKFGGAVEGGTAAGAVKGAEGAAAGAVKGAEGAAAGAAKGAGEGAAAGATRGAGEGAAVPKEVPESIPAGPSAKPTAAQQRAINEMGEAHGCHTCGTKMPGTKSGNWVGDHQPSTAVNPPGNPQVYRPQCQLCSWSQGGQVRAAQAKAAAAAKRAAAAASKKTEGN